MRSHVTSFGCCTTLSFTRGDGSKRSRGIGCDGLLCGIRLCNAWTCAFLSATHSTR
jgi:hypothetical protein